MPEASIANMLVYRDSRSRVPASALLRRLRGAVASLGSRLTQDALLNALLCAGELECALCDTKSEDAALAVPLTDHIASLACYPEPGVAVVLHSCQQLLDSIRYDGELTVSRPEGFAYYALHPLDFAELVASARLTSSCAHVVGIRSIGTTLSAVVAARLNADGIPATRTTARPHGHPYDRRTAFNAEQCHGISQALAHGALFLVCDEGPGRSGSSLLSVAEALEEQGVSRERVVLLCSHEPDPDELCAPRATERWRRYRSLPSGMTRRLPRQAGDYQGGGEWRRFFIPEGEPWPIAWPHMERLKFLSLDGKTIFKFAGHGPYGDAVRRRDELLAGDGFGASYLGYEAGFGIYEVIAGRPPAAARPTLALLSHIAKYCAWRTAAFPAMPAADAVRQLEHMVATNLSQEFGFAPQLQLEVERPAICDGRMQPYKWRELVDEQWIKLDASTHGDDHFFPGPTDIAWDLAAFCMEWQLHPHDREFFFSEYRRLSGDNPEARLQAYEIAYAAFRLGWSRMAAASVSGTDDEPGLLQDAERYRAALDRILAASTLSR